MCVRERGSAIEGKEGTAHFLLTACGAVITGRVLGGILVVSQRRKNRSLRKNEGPTLAEKVGQEAGVEPCWAVPCHRLPCAVHRPLVWQLAQLVWLHALDLGLDVVKGHGEDRTHKAAHDRPSKDAHCAALLGPQVFQNVPRLVRLSKAARDWEGRKDAVSSLNCVGRRIRIRRRVFMAHRRQLAQIDRHAPRHGHPAPLP